VKVGDKAYVGSGSVITDNVPAGALALGRGRQVNKPDWKPGKATAKAAETAKPAATAKPKAAKAKKAKTKR
jgi:bifunctional UDP-N-acetylglucosamine pyrophosphorylase/glucosamine-1-phosphate N-acetyltransferase